MKDAHSTPRGKSGASGRWKGTPLGQAVAALRNRAGLTKGELLRRAKMKDETLIGYERGVHEPQAEPLSRLAAALEVSPQRLAELESFFRVVDGIPRDASLAPALEAITGGIGLSELVALCGKRVLAASSRSYPNSGEVPDREGARTLVAVLASLSADSREPCIERSRAFRGSLVVTELGEFSVMAAAQSVLEAKHWAHLAWQAARLTFLPEPGRRRLLAQALAYQANAARVGSELELADAVFSRALALQEQGAPLVGLDESRFLDLLASLRHGQRRFPESLGLLHRALDSAPRQSIARILMLRAKTFHELGRNTESLADLASASALIDHEAEPRMAWAVDFNRLVNLCALGRTAEAEPLLPLLRDVGGRLANDLDTLRLDWLEAKVDAGQGRSDAAIERLDRVRRAFLERRIVYDAALATLELAVFLLEAGRTQEVKDHARELGRTFQSQGVEREALASLLVYRQAAEQERLTLAVLREVISGWRGRERNG